MILMERRISDRQEVLFSLQTLFVYGYATAVAIGTTTATAITVATTPPRPT